MKALNIQIEDRQHEWIRRQAFERRISMADVVRDEWAYTDYGIWAETWRVNSRLHWARYSTSGTRVAHGTGWSSTPTEEELARWDKAALDIIARAQRADLPSALYIRWNDLPKNGRSRNHATGKLEKGVSVYGAQYNPVTDLIEYAEDGTGCHAALTYLLSGAPCYLVTGTEVARGSDGEPILHDVQINSEA